MSLNKFMRLDTNINNSFKDYDLEAHNKIP